MELYLEAPYMRFAAATMVLVLPVPGGPYNNKCGRLSLSIIVVIMLMIFSCATKSSSLDKQVAIEVNAIERREDWQQKTQKEELDDKGNDTKQVFLLPMYSR